MKEYGKFNFAFTDGMLKMSIDFNYKNCLFYPPADERQKPRDFSMKIFGRLTITHIKESPC
jgi:hypothetical protein